MFNAWQGRHSCGFSLHWSKDDVVLTCVGKSIACLVALMHMALVHGIPVLATLAPVSLVTAYV